MQGLKKGLWYTVGLVFIGVVVGIILTSNLDWTPRGFATKKELPAFIESGEGTAQAVINLQETGKAFSAVSKAVLSTVVSISTSKIIERSQNSDEFWGPLLRDFFGREFQQEPQVQRQHGLGSGVIVSPDGYILTNHHVISNADDIKVTLNDNRIFDAELVGTDPLTEVAVIKINGKDLPAARLGDSEAMEVGEWVLAIGNPLQLSSTVTAGIVSAVGRAIGIIEDEDAAQSGGSYAIENFIQTDAAINPGNSGGALVNLKAEVIGINTAIATRTGYYQGYGFAIPINLAKKIMNDLIQQGYVVRAWIGISMQSVNEAMAERFGMDRPQGVIIGQVSEGSPAHEAGLKNLDILLKVEGKEVSQGNEVQSIIALKNPGDVVTLTILREGIEKKVKVKLGQKETGRERVQTREIEEDLPELGLTVQDLTGEIRSRYREFEGVEGILVTVVEPYSAAFNAGIRRGAVITQIEDERIRTVSDYRKALRKFEKGKVVIFYIQDGNNQFHAFVKLPK